MKVLIVVDMQNDFITGSLANPFAQEIVDPVAEKIRNFDGAVIFTKDTHNENYLETQEGKNLPVAHCLKNTEGWDVNKKLMEAVAANDSGYKYYNVEKEYFGYGTWKDILKCLDCFWDKLDLDSIELCGTVASICVVSNALILKATFPEVPVIVNKNLIADITEEGKQSALTVMKNCQVILED